MFSVGLKMNFKTSIADFAKIFMYISLAILFYCTCMKDVIKEYKDRNTLFASKTIQTENLTFPTGNILSKN